MTGECAPKGTILVANHDILYRRIRSRYQGKEAEGDDEDVHEESDIPADSSRPPEVRAIVGIAHTHVRDTPVDPAEEAIEEGAHQRQQIREERDDFGNDEGKDPGHAKDTDPACPAHDGVVSKMARAGEKAEKDKAGGDGSVENTEEDQCWDHEGEGDLEVEVVSKRAECRRRVIVRSGVAVDDAADK